MNRNHFESTLLELHSTLVHTKTLVHRKWPNNGIPLRTHNEPARRATVPANMSSPATHFLVSIKQHELVLVCLWSVLMVQKTAP